MKTVSESLAELKWTPAYENGEGRIAIDEASVKILAADSAGNTARVLELSNALAARLREIAAAIDPDAAEAAGRAPSGGERTSLLPEDVRWCEELVEREYDTAAATTGMVLDSSKGEALPSKAKVKASILRQLTPEKVKELRKLREPALLILPDTTAERMVSAGNNPALKTMPGQIDTGWDNHYKNALSATAATRGVPAEQSKITKFRFAVVEGKQHFDAQASDHDFAFNKRETMENQIRIAAFDEYCKQTGMQSIDAVGYELLMIRGLKERKPTDMIDNSSWQFTMLTGEPRNEYIKGGLVAAGYWLSDGRKPYFSYGNLGNQFGRARLRPAVMGEISL